MKPMAIRRASFPLMAAFILLFQVSCDFWGGASRFLVTEEDERRLGEQFHTDLTTAKQSQYPLSTNAVVNAYVDSLGQEIVKRLDLEKGERPEYDFTFTVIQDDVENAFAVPGGYVYIYTGILKSMGDEAELVGVLGHEVAHVTRHHYRSQLAKQAALITAIKLLRGEGSSPLGDAAFGLLANLAHNKNSRADEAESDKYGTRYAGSLGVNPLGIATFFQKMAAQSGLLAWFSSHPSPPNRVQAVNAQVDADATLKALATEEKRNQQRFLQKTASLR